MTDQVAFYCFRIGELTSYCTILAVMPSFFICKMDPFAAKTQLKTI